ncbi:MAG: UDP-N-acetyl-D-mannosamine dehydrogenase [Flammeovirgaceae bacterium]
MNKNINVVMMGLGYIGLPTAALIAGKGIKVLGVDVKKEAVDIINQGKIHIIEPDLEGLVNYAVTNGFLKADVKPVKADVYLIAVPTPFKGEFVPDLAYVESATRLITPFLEKGNLVILESTSPVGTTEKVASWIFSIRPELKGQIHLAYCPERVLPGRILHELENNDRAIGGLDKSSAEKAAAFYSLFVKGDLHQTNARTAEMCKLVENSYRDTNIAFANELSMICDRVGINVWELIELANKHPRVKILTPGPGVGGHCIAVDPWFIVHDFPNESKIIRTAREVNNHKPEWVLEKVSAAAKDFLAKNNRQPVIACMGLAFKPDIDDLRESPSLEITEKLIKHGYKVLAVEPNLENSRTIELTDSADAINKADILLFLVAHKFFKEITLGQIASKVVIDVCGLFKMA